MADFQLLGPVEVRDARGRLVPVGHPRQQCVLAVLLIEAARQVSAEALIDRVWGDSPPSQARRALQSHISRVRRVIVQAGAGPALVTKSGGYRLDVSVQTVDLHRSRGLVARARDGLPVGERAAVLRAAVQCWRGEPLAGVGGEWAVRARDNLLKERADTLMHWATAEVDAGHPDRVVTPLRELLADFPFAEGAAAVLISALSSTGSNSEALAEYAATRGRLSTELGTEPGPELQAVHRAVLTASAQREVIALRCPAQLPGDLFGFTGRAESLGRLDELPRRRGSMAAPVAVVTGTAGVGKTALAVHWAHAVRAAFPDGQLYADLCGFDPSAAPADPGDVLRGFLLALDVPAGQVPAGYGPLAALYRSVVEGRQLLVILDNAHDADQVRPLLPGSSSTVCVVTSRRPLTGLLASTNALVEPLPLLDPEDARRLLATRLGPASLAASNEDSVQTIVERCSGLPLALAVVAARAALRPDTSLDLMAAELAAEPDPLGVVRRWAPEADLTVVFSWSYRELGTAAARLFRLFGQYLGPELTVDAAASLAGLPPAGTRTLLAELTAASLIVENQAGRYTLHDLLRGYARGLSAADLDTDVAIGRLLDHYVHTGSRAAMLMNPGRSTVDLDPVTDDVTVTALSDAAAARAWLQADNAVLLAAVRYAAEHGREEASWRIAWVLVDFLDRHGRWAEWAAMQQVALAAAGRLPRAAPRAHTHQGLSIVHGAVRDFPTAHAHLDQAIELFAHDGDGVREARCHVVRAWLLEREGRLGDALIAAEQTLLVMRERGATNHLGIALNGVGWAHVRIGDHARGLALCAAAVAAEQAHGSPIGVANALDSLGNALLGLGRPGDATRHFRHAVDICHRIGNEYYEAITIDHLGDALAAAGDLDGAAARWRRALAALQELDPVLASEVAPKLRSLTAIAAPT